MTIRIKVDQALCQGHGVCLSECPEVFDVGEQEQGYPMVQVRLEALRENVELAARYCPNHVISIEQQ